jgi:hypothetical protein
MKKYSIFIILVALSFQLSAQSEATKKLQARFENSFSLYFYKNTLRMLNQDNNPEFDELVKNIEKMKFLMIDKGNSKFSTADYKSLLKSYSSEEYEEVMTSRFDGKNFDIYLKDKKGSTLGTVMLVNDSSKLYVLDILGTIDVSKASKFFSTLNESSELGQKVKSFLAKDEKKAKKAEAKID